MILGELNLNRYDRCHGKGGEIQNCSRVYKENDYVKADVKVSGMQLKAKEHKWLLANHRGKEWEEELFCALSLENTLISKLEQGKIKYLCF